MRAVKTDAGIGCAGTEVSRRWWETAQFYIDSTVRPAGIYETSAHGARFLPVRWLARVANDRHIALPGDTVMARPVLAGAVRLG